MLLENVFPIIPLSQASQSGRSKVMDLIKHKHKCILSALWSQPLPTQSTGSPEFQQNFFGRFISSLLCLFTPVAEMLQQGGLEGVASRAG